MVIFHQWDVDPTWIAYLVGGFFLAGATMRVSQPINECCFHIPLKRWMLVMLIIYIYIHSMKSLYEWAIVGSYPYFSWYQKLFLWSPWPTVRALKTPQVIGAVIIAAWHMAREKVSTNWAKVPILGGLQCHQERRDVLWIWAAEKNVQWVVGRSTIFTDPFAYFQINWPIKKCMFSSCDLKLVTPVFPPGNL